MDMKSELVQMYNFLSEKKLRQHASDFWCMRKQKQPMQVDTNALLHEHTAIRQYIEWHGFDGTRLATRERASDHSLLRHYQSIKW